MARSLAPLFLLSLLVSTVAAARTVSDDDAPGILTVQDACSKTEFPKICEQDLSPGGPSAQKRTMHQIVGDYLKLVDEAASKNVVAYVHGELTSGKHANMFRCLDSCMDDLEEVAAHVSATRLAFDDPKLLELKSWLASTLGGTSNCEDAFADLPKSVDKDELLLRTRPLDKMLRIMRDLLVEASESVFAV